MSNESTASDVKTETGNTGNAKPAKGKPAIKKRQAKKAKKAAAKKAKPAAKKPVQRPDVPRGFESEEAKARVEQAHKVLIKLYPTMTEKQRIAYLTEVGAGRYMALRRFEAE